MSYPHFPHPLLLLLNKIFKKDRRILLEETMRNFRSAKPKDPGLFLKYSDLETRSDKTNPLVESTPSPSIELLKTQSHSS
jgi:hypothetical protein